MTLLARHEHIRQKVHLDSAVAAALACLAASALHVEREAPRLVAAYLRLGQIDEHGTYVVKHAGICSRIGAWRATNRRLVYIHHLVYIIYTLDTVVGHRLLQRAVEVLRENRLQCLVDKRRLARSAHARHHDELAQRKLYVNILQVVALRTAYHDALAVALASLGRYLYLTHSVKVVGGDGVLLKHLSGRSLEHNLATTNARLRTNVNDIIGIEHHVAVVFYHNHGVAHVAQLLQRVDKTIVVALMQTDARLVEDVEHVDELRTDLSGKANTLALAAGKRCRLA